MAAPRVLFVHQNFPGQFPHIAAAVLKRGWKGAVIGSKTARNTPGLDVRRWTAPRGSTPNIFEPATRAEADLIRAEAAAEVAFKLKADGFIPDLIIGHPGWGETIHLSEIFPKAPQLLFGEFYYRSSGADVGFDTEFEQRTERDALKTSAKNMGLARAYTDAELIVCPTPFQASTFPKGFQSRIRVLHEGVDLGAARKRSNAVFTTPSGLKLDGSTPVITFINRNFERLRGFHIFMRALPAFLAAVPEAQVILIGADSDSGYGGKLAHGQTWRQKMEAELGGPLDPARVHFVGRVPHSQMIDALSISWAHVYYTYPFVLSWSLVEAMGCECLILASDTAPVRDAVTHNLEGILNDFFDVPALTEAMIAACRQPEAFTDLRRQARQTALARFDRETVGVPGWMQLIDEALGTRG